MLKEKLASIKSKMGKGPGASPQSSNYSEADSFNTANLDQREANRKDVKKSPVLEKKPPQGKVNALQLTLGGISASEEEPSLMRKTLGEEQPNSTKSKVKKTFDFESKPF